MQNDKSKFKIKKIKAREILDSRGNPTIEVELAGDFGKVRASVPSGKSKGKYEAVELRDGGKRYKGMGVLKAVRNINEIIEPKIKDKDPTEQKEIDELIIELDGTKNKAKLGANAILAVSMVVCRAGAAATNLPLYKYINKISKLAEVRPRLTLPSNKLPVPCFNIINGGAHTENDLDIQEFMVVPQTNSFKSNFEMVSKIYATLKSIIKEKYKTLKIGDEGGFSPSIKEAKEAIELILQAANRLGCENKIKIILDCAASEFFKDERYSMKIGQFSREKLTEYYLNLINNYPIVGLEDPFSQDDWKAWKALSLKSKFLVIGDDLTATNPERIKLAQRENACNGIIVKPNQIGTVTEAIEAAKLAKSFDWKIIVSHRSGETMDDFISDFAVGIDADFIKAGAPAKPERLTKYNRLLRIEEELNR